jgi:hypothetical protein
MRVKIWLVVEFSCYVLALFTWMSDWRHCTELFGACDRVEPKCYVIGGFERTCCVNDDECDISSVKCSVKLAFGIHRIDEVILDSTPCCWNEVMRGKFAVSTIRSRACTLALWWRRLLKLPLSQRQVYIALPISHIDFTTTRYLWWVQEPTVLNVEALVKARWSECCLTKRILFIT